MLETNQVFVQSFIDVRLFLSASMNPSLAVKYRRYTSKGQKYKYFRSKKIKNETLAVKTLMSVEFF